MYRCKTAELQIEFSSYRGAERKLEMNSFCFVFSLPYLCIGYKDNDFFENMPTKNGTTFQQIMTDLKAGRFLPIYILMGDEPYYIDKISDYIAENALPPEERDFNQTIVYGADTTAMKICDQTHQFPMMAKYQVIIVKEAQAIKSLDPLERYLRKPVASTILVWCYKNGTIDKRKKVVSLAQTVGVVFESKKLRDYQLPSFVSSYLHDHKATIDQKAAQMISDHVGADLNRLTSELDKLLIGLPEGNRQVTPEVVEREIGVSKDFNTFELRDAIIQKNVFKANQIIKYFDSNPRSGSIYKSLPMIFNFFQNLMIVHYSRPNKTENDVARALGLKTPWGAKSYITGMRNYSPAKTKYIISAIRSIDAKSKGIDNPDTEAGDLMKELIFFILH